MSRAIIDMADYRSTLEHGYTHLFYRNSRMREPWIGNLGVLPSAESHISRIVRLYNRPEDKWEHAGVAYLRDAIRAGVDEAIALLDEQIDAFLTERGFRPKDIREIRFDFTSTRKERELKGYC